MYGYLELKAENTLHDSLKRERTKKPKDYTYPLKLIFTVGNTV